MSKSFKKVSVGFKVKGGFEYLLPMKTVTGDGIGVYPLGAITLPSCHSSERMMGTLLRKMPIAEMHQPYYQNLLFMLAGLVPECALYIESPPTTGKTTLGQVLAEATGGTCAMITCANMSMDELVVETYVNGKQGPDIFSRLSAQLARGEVAGFYLIRLREALGKALVHIEQIEGAVPRSTIEALHERLPHAVRETKMAGSGASEYSILWDKIPADELEKTKEFLDSQDITTRPTYRIDLAAIDKAKLGDTAKEISAIALEMGLAKESGGLGVGLATRNGKLLETILSHLSSNEPAVIVLDEFTRRRDDGGSLQQFYEVIGGKRDECSLIGGDGKQHVITRQALKDAGIAFIINANPKTADEPNVLPAPGAFLSRLGTPSLSGYGAAGWQMRMEQFLAGMPLTFILDAWRPEESAQQKHFNDELAADLLAQVHEMGLNETAKANIPLHQKSFLRKHQDFSDATGKLAKFFDLWRQAADPESELNASASEHGYLTDASTTLKEVRREAQICAENPHHPSHNVKIDLRWLQAILISSLHINPTPEPYAQVKGKHWHPGEDEPEAQFGERLIKRIRQEIETLYPNPNSKIRAFLEMQMVRCGLCMGDDLSLNDAKLTEIGANPRDVRTITAPEKTAKNRLNIPRLRTISEEAKLWQALLVADLARKYPESFDATALQTPDKILSVGLVHDALVNLPQLMKEEVFAVEDQSTVPLIAVNVTRKKKGIALGHALLVPGAKPSDFELPDATRFLMTLAMPGATGLIKDRLWQKSAGVNDEASLICRNESKSGLALTTLQLDDHVDAEGGKVPTYMHVLRFSHESKEKFLIVGDLEIDTKLKLQLRDQKVIYISRGNPQAKEQLETQLADFIQLGSTQANNAVDYKVQLHRAFRHRNEPQESWRKQRAAELNELVENLQEETDLFGNKTLADLMLDPSLTRPHKNQVVVMAELSPEALDEFREKAKAEAKTKTKAR